MTTLDQYKSAGGIIISPGKFIGQPAWVPHFDGLPPDDLFLIWPAVSHAVYVVGAEDRALFPALKGVFAVVLSQDDGPVTGRAFATDYDLWVFIAESELGSEG